MNFIKTLVALFILASVVACSSTKTKEGSNETATTETVNKDDKMIKEGYIKGTIVFSDKPDDCPYTIQLEGNDNLMYDPINLDVKFQKHDDKIWFTFNQLRRMNRCLKANPISLIDIKKRT